MADERVSRILCAACPSPRLASRPVRPTRCGDHSSSPDITIWVEQPTRGSQRVALSGAAHTGWASPPLLFGLAPRGVFRAPDVATRAVGSYPTFSPLPNALDRKRRAPGSAAGLPPRYKLTGGLFSVALSVAAFLRRAFVRRRAQPPGVTRRVALPSRTLASSRRPESGLSSRSFHLRETNRRSPGSSADAIIRCHAEGHNRPSGRDFPTFHLYSHGPFE